MIEVTLFNIISGLILGSVYGLSTMGLNIIFGVLKIINVAHGQLMMLGAYLAFWFFVIFGLIPFITIPPSIIIGIALGFVIFYTTIRRLIEAPEMLTLVATFAIGILLEEAAKFVWGPDYRAYSWHAGEMRIFEFLLPFTKVYSALLSIVLAVFLHIFLQKTTIGTALRATIQNPEGALVCGVDVEKIRALGFAIGISVTLMGGVLLTLFIPVGINPYMGHEYTLKAFVIAVLGGLGSTWGAFFGGVIFGIVENSSYQIFSYLGFHSPFSMTFFLAFFLLLLILLVRPRGLFGR
ncbi:MAG: branched-chain amino acid ABC transporter permease [Nitrososphaerales archaeon]|nr:branched-chain amino acid ABC transporter permease [Nitrososphaerales archaeon]